MTSVHEVVTGRHSHRRLPLLGLLPPTERMTLAGDSALMLNRLSVLLALSG